MPVSSLCSAMQCHCESMHVYAFAYLFIALPLLIIACHFDAMPLLTFASPCDALANVSLLRLCESVPWLAIACKTYLCHALAVTSLQCLCCANPIYAFAPRCPTLLCNTVADQNLAMPSHTIYAPYASAYHIGVHLCCAVANQNYAIASQNLPLPCLCNAYPSYAHCNSVESYAFAILCLAPIRCAIALNLCAFP